MIARYSCELRHKIGEVFLSLPPHTGTAAPQGVLSKVSCIHRDRDRWTRSAVHRLWRYLTTFQSRPFVTHMAHHHTQSHPHRPTCATRQSLASLIHPSLLARQRRRVRALDTVHRA